MGSVDREVERKRRKKMREEEESGSEASNDGKKAEMSERHVRCPYAANPFSTKGMETCGHRKFPDMPTLIRDHLKKFHRLFVCGNCGVRFRSEEGESHKVDGEPCNKNDRYTRDYLQGMDEGQFHQLNPKPRYYPGSSEPHNRWQIVYKILFPDSEDIPDPFHKGPYTREHISPEIREALRRSLTQPASIYMDEVLDRLETISRSSTFPKEKANEQTV